MRSEYLVAVEFESGNRGPEVVARADAARHDSLCRLPLMPILNSRTSSGRSRRSPRKRHSRRPHPLVLDPRHCHIIKNGTPIARSAKVSPLKSPRATPLLGAERWAMALPANRLA